MKNNYITLKDKNNKKKDYRVLFNIEDTTNKLNYVIYTNDLKNKDGELKIFASSYVLSDAGNMTKFKPVETKEEFEFIEKILNSLGDNSD